MEVVAPWPEELPAGRVVSIEDRHLTLAFLGASHLPTLHQLLKSFPDPGFRIGLAGMFDHPLFLPPRQPRVAAWRVHLLEHRDLFMRFQERLIEWLKERGIEPKRQRGVFIPHVSIARRPFSISEWKAGFAPLPMYVKNIRLCESKGLLQYETCWSYPILAPFEEMEHTADLLFIARGIDFRQLYLHAALALAFRFPALIRYLETQEIRDLEDLILKLNRLIGIADREEGCPFKAVSLHGKVKTSESGILEWEMIVDV